MICPPRVTSGNSTGAVMMRKQVAGGFIQDYDSIQGNHFVQHFYQMRASRLYPNVPLYFDVDQRLEGKRVSCIELVDGTQMGTFAGVDIPSSFNQAWVTLCNNCGDVLAELPISRFNRVLNGGKNLFFRAMPVDWSKSYITFQNVGSLSSSGFLFNIWIL